MATRKSLCVKLARTCLAAAVAAGATFAANAAEYVKHLKSIKAGSTTR